MAIAILSKGGKIMLRPDFDLNNSNDVRSAQKFLRTISQNYDSISSVVPDGIFGRQTEQSVTEFQRYFGIEPTGVIDFETWNKLVEVNGEVIEENREAVSTFIYPESNPVILPGESNLNMYVIQAMIYVLSLKTDTIPSVQINGVLDEQTVDAVKIVQMMFGLPVNGVVDKILYEALAVLYEVYVSRNRVENFDGAPPPVFVNSKK